METLLRKYLWAIDLAVIALSAVFAARATGVALESVVIRSTPPARAATRAVAEAATPAAHYGKQVEDILKRNIFCSTCPPIIEPPKVAQEEAPKELPPVRTNLPLKLMAVMYAPPPSNPKWSMAIIRDNDAKTAGPYGVGGKIRTAVVSHIEETRVYLDNAGKREYLDLIDRPQAMPPQGTPAAAAPSSDPFAAELDRGIRKVSEHSYVIQRSTVDSLLGNMAVLSRSARIVPEVRDGRSAGFRLFSIKPDGPFGKIGLQNGDVIHAINGMEMTSPDNALMVYTKLKSASHLSVALERGGQKITKDYNIQ